MCLGLPGHSGSNLWIRCGRPGGNGISLTREALPAYRQKENEQNLKAVAEAFLAALKRGTRLKPRLLDVIVFHAQGASFDELEKQAPADHTYWADPGWPESGRRYNVDVPVYPLYHSLGTAVKCTCADRFEGAA